LPNAERPEVCSVQHTAAAPRGPGRPRPGMEDVDEESVWGHALRHKLALKDESLQQLIASLSAGDADSISSATPETMESFFRVFCALLRKEPWLQSEVAATFAGICGMDAAKLAAVVNRDWFVIAMLRLLREPPADDQVFVSIVTTLRDLTAHSSSRPENIAWLCTEAVLELCLGMVTSPFSPVCITLVDLMMTAAMELGPVARRSFVSLATAHANSRYFGETLLRTMNESELDVDEPPPVGYRPALMVLGDMHSQAETADFLFPADQRVLLDVLLRHVGGIALTPSMEETWLAWIRTVGGIATNSKQCGDHPPLGYLGGGCARSDHTAPLMYPAGIRKVVCTKPTTSWTHSRCCGRQRQHTDLRMGSLHCLRVRIDPQLVLAVS
jgi:hypothetical protein